MEDILGAIAAIQRYTAGMSLDGFSADDRTVDAVMHNIMVLGEAAAGVPDEVARRYPSIPWDKMRAIRNVVVHMYFGIQKDILWQTIQVDIPPLIPVFQRILHDAR